MCACKGRDQGRHDMLCEDIITDAFGSVADAPQDVLNLMQQTGRFVPGQLAPADITAGKEKDGPVKKYVNKVLDRAEGMQFHIPIAAVSLGTGLGQVLNGHSYGWFFLGLGLVMTAIRPFGTSLRRRLIIRQIHRNIDEIKAQMGDANDR